MTESTVNQSNKSTDLNKLQSVIEDMDALAQGGFSEISALAKLALAALQTPQGYRDIESIVQALQAIRGKAEDINNCINYTAETVGCNYKDERLYSRYGAQRAAREMEQGKPRYPEASGPDLKLVH